MVADSEGTAEKSASQEDAPPVDSNKNPKRLMNDETVSNPKKKVSVAVTVLSVFSLECFI